MATLYFYVYRACFALRGRFPRCSTDGAPGSVNKTLHALGLLLKRSTPADLRVTVRVQSGLSRGLWIRARFPEEASYWRGRRERSTEEAILAAVAEGSVVYDIGAHVGSLAFGTARLVGERGRVVAFEADPDNVSSLRKCCRLNRFEGRIQVVHAAVWSYSTIQGVSFRRGATRPSHGGVDADGHRPVLADGPTITVPAVTLDDFIASSGPSPQLIKIDVEGGEYEVLRGGETLFTRLRPRIIVEVHHREAFEQINTWIQKFGYSAHWSVPQEGFPRILFAWPGESGPIL